MTSLNTRRLALAAALLMALGWNAHAQQPAWPTKPVRMIVPFAAGGSTDVVARMVGQRLNFQVQSQADGSVQVERVAHATGSPDNPVTDAQLNTKFLGLAGSVLPKARAKRLLDTLWALERVEDMATVVALCRLPARSSRVQHAKKRMAV